MRCVTAGVTRSVATLKQLSDFPAAQSLGEREGRVTDGSSAMQELPRLPELDYKTAVEAWRQMVDIRFKLLALLPAATSLGVSQRIPCGASIAGLVSVIRLSSYEIRNTRIHDALAKRLVELERLLGDGMVAARVRSPNLFRVGLECASGRSVSSRYGITVRSGSSTAPAWPPGPGRCAHRRSFRLYGLL